MQAGQREQVSHDFGDAALLGGRTVLVAGGTGKVGQYLVRSLLDHGANVVVPSRSAQRLAALRDSLADRHVERFSSFVCDLRDEATADLLRDELPKTARSLQGVVASLGRFVTSPSLLTAPVADIQNALNDYLI